MKLTDTRSAWVTIAGKRAEEYGLEISEDGMNATCWIASELGKRIFPCARPSTASKLMEAGNAAKLLKRSRTRSRYPPPNFADRNSPIRLFAHPAIR
ncbi:hypothetical protein CPB85DRAFT_1301601 [Mucidula mucida]|nr:hypothetical protein CPB85DRAFT_1361906 [Mucidula mucida]KAF8912567.1 hypothetical protein CPB85DRAFT_1301601 [Mucidula mucida]